MSAPAAKAEQAKAPAADRSAPLQRSSAEAAFDDRRPVAAAQRQQQGLISNSPRVQRAAAQQALLAQSPRQQATQLQAVTAAGPGKMAEPKQLQPTPAKANTTGLPDQLKAGVESLSGYSLDDVRVHYNSAQPAQLQAHAYAQGTDIHVAPGQEQHLPHEAWHVVQQKQGRVQATRQLKGLGVNDDSGLEQEASAMGSKALQMRATGATAPLIQHAPRRSRVFQLAGKDALNYVRKNPSSFPKLHGITFEHSKDKLNREEVLALLNDEGNSLGHREQLRREWNKKMPITHAIGIEETLYGPALELEQESRLKKHKSEAPLDKVNGYDSDGESNVGLVEQLRATLSSARKATVVTKEKKETVAYVFTLAEAVMVMRKIRKFNLFDDFPAVHLIVKLGAFWQLYTAPRGNDFAYAPIAELLPLEPGRFMRAGSIDTWHAIALELAAELDALQSKDEAFKSGKFKDQVTRIVSTFNGGSGPMTQGESHAVGAIVCDYAAGVRGSLYYLYVLFTKVDMGAITDHMAAWAGASPAYVPAAVGGRGIVGSTTSEVKSSGTSSSSSSSSSSTSKAKPRDAVMVQGRRYTTQVDGIRDGGECFWDTMRRNGISDEHLAAAAATAGLTVDQAVNHDAIPRFFEALAPHTHLTYTVHLDIIDLITLRPIHSRAIGSGTSVVNIGLFVDTRTGLGHYVPNV